MRVKLMMNPREDEYDKDDLKVSLVWKVVWDAFHTLHKFDLR